MMIYIVLIWFLLIVLQESSNLDDSLFVLTPPFLVKSQLIFNFFKTLYTYTEVHIAKTELIQVHLNFIFGKIL